MTKHNAALFLPLVQALADGKAIQFRPCESDQWRDTDAIDTKTWAPKAYRIKPEPREWLVTVATKGNQRYAEGSIVQSDTHRHIDRPNENDRWEYVRVREILD